jgi:hypothetical protein
VYVHAVPLNAFSGFKTSSLLDGFMRIPKFEIVLKAKTIFPGSPYVVEVADEFLRCGGGDFPTTGTWKYAQPKMKFSPWN